MKYLWLGLICTVFMLGCGEGSTNTETGPLELSPDDQIFNLVGDYAGSHIVLAYAGATRATPEVTRTKEQAEEEAWALTARLQEDPSLFEDLARKHSDGPTGPQGGNLGSWNHGDMAAPFDEAIAELQVGEITSEPVETQFGYHIIRRNSSAKKHYAAYAFLVAFAGHPRVPDSVQRSTEEAQALAQEIRRELTRDNFDELAKKYNDLGTEALFMGVFQKTDDTIPGLVDSVEAMNYGDVAGPIAFPVGYAFVKRARVVKRAGAHILISYKGATRAKSSVKRTKEEAQALAEELLVELKDDPTTFEVMAEEYSDGDTKWQGGRLIWFEGELDPTFNTAFDNLGANEIADQVVETDFGFHLIRRDPLPASEIVKE